MRSRLWVLLIALLVLIPTAAAFHQPDKPKQNPNEKGGRHHFSGSIPTIETRVIRAGEVGNWSDGTYKFTGQITIEAGGLALVSNASALFSAESHGFHVLSGGTLRIIDATLEPEGLSSSFRVVADPNAHLRLDGAHVKGGRGAAIATDLAIVVSNTFEGIPLAVHVLHANITLENNAFLANGVGVNQTGGFPVLRNNSFEGGTYCVRDWLSDPTIVGNRFIGCSYGIWHERSESFISDNEFIDKADPPGTGLSILDTMSPIVSGNNISNWGTGILIRNARGFVRENTLHGNVLDGIRIEGNSAPMDVTGNTIYGNGRDGIRLVGAWDVPVSENLVTNNAGHGIYGEGISNVTILSNTIRGNGGDGVRLASGSSLVVENNLAEANAASGFVLGAAVSEARLSKNEAVANALDGYSLAGRDLVLETGVAASNGRDGFAFADAAGVEADGPVSTGNAGAGFRAARAESLVLVAATANANGDGFVVEAGNRGLIIDGATAHGNVRDGLRNAEGATAAPGGSWVGNGEFGVRNLDPAAKVDARNGWWGSSTGPRHTLNPLGTGDRVSDGVAYVPFATSPTAN